jgi:hypothetical protein
MSEQPMTRDEWDALVGVAAMLWPHERAFFAEPPEGAPSSRDVWYASLQRFAHRDVGDGLGKLAESSTHFPALAELVAATRLASDVRSRREEAAVPLLEAPRRRPVTDGELTEAYLVAMRQVIAEEQEAARYAGATEGELHLVAMRVRNRWRRALPKVIAAIGPHEDDLAGTGAEPVAARGCEVPAAGVATEVIDTTARAVLSTEEIDQRAQEIVRRLDAGEPILPAAIEEPVRNRVRAIRAARRQPTPPAAAPAGG